MSWLIIVWALRIEILKLLVWWSLHKRRARQYFIIFLKLKFMFLYKAADLHPSINLNCHKVSVCFVLIWWKIILFSNKYMDHISLAGKKSRWECYSKYREHSCFIFFLSIQCTNRSHLAMVALNACQKTTVARWHLLVYWMQGK